MPKKSDDWERWEKEMMRPDTGPFVEIHLANMAQLDAKIVMDQNPEFGV